MKDQYVIIVGGGTGARMGSEIPKQFLPVKERPIILHSIEKFLIFNKQINLIIVLPEAEFSRWNDICKKFQFSIPHKLVCGGNTRFESVRNGLAEIKENGVVAVHDAVRPLVSIDTIKRCFSEAKLKGTCIPVMPISESLRRINKSGTQAVNRIDFVTVQTPQVFEISILKKAYEHEFSDDFTDDASLVERDGIEIYYVEGNPENIKITRQIDIQLAELLIQ